MTTDHPPASVPTPAQPIGMFNPVSRRFCYLDETRKLKEEPGYCVPVYAIKDYEMALNKADELRRENAALRIERDKAIAQERAQYDVRCAIQHEVNEAGFTGCDDEGVRELVKELTALRSANAELAAALEGFLTKARSLGASHPHLAEYYNFPEEVWTMALAVHAAQKAGGA